MAKLSLHFTGIVRAGPQALRQRRQRKEIHQTEGAPTIGDDDEWIRGGKVGPGDRQGGRLAVGVKEPDPVLGPVPSVLHELVALPRQRVERVGHLETSGLPVRMACI